MARLMRLQQAEPQSDEAVGDLRFRSLLGAEQWAILPVAVQRRFAKRYVAGRSVSYSGVIEECRMSRAG